MTWKKGQGRVLIVISVSRIHLNIERKLYSYTVAEHAHKKDGQICAAFSIKKDKVLFFLKKIRKKLYYCQQNVNNNKNTYFYNQRNKNGAKKVERK